MEPPPSLPSAIGTNPAATAAEPTGTAVSSGSMGFRGSKQQIVVVPLCQTPGYWSYHDDGSCFLDPLRRWHLLGM